MLIKCKECGKLMNARGNKQYCSDKCRNKSFQKKHPKVREKACKRCGKMFKPNSKLKNYCSLKCSMYTPAPPAKHKCPVCGEIFYGSKSKVYCSEACRRAKGTGKIPQKGENRPKKRESQIDKVNMQAREKGMSYGAYKAFLYLQEHKANIL